MGGFKKTKPSLKLVPKQEVEIEFQGEPWPPLDEVTESMRRSREHLSGLGLGLG